LSFEVLSLPLRVGDPSSGDWYGVLVIEQGPVVGELPIAVGDGRAQRGFSSLGGRVGQRRR
jgi:hypothetical protein